MLITDTSYTDDEYEAKLGWGHSCVSRAVDFAHQASVKSLHLFHHEPNQLDSDIDAKLESARQLMVGLNATTDVIAPAEGETYEI